MAVYTIKLSIENWNYLAVLMNSGNPGAMAELRQLLKENTTFDWEEHD